MRRRVDDALREIGAERLSENAARFGIGQARAHQSIGIMRDAREHSVELVVRQPQPRCEIFVGWHALSFARWDHAIQFPKAVDWYRDDCLGSRTAFRERQAKISVRREPARERAGAGV